MPRLKSYAVKTDQGPYLQLNEDLVEIDLSNNLFLIFDGFGGSGVGDKAAQEVSQQVKKFYTKISDDPESTLPLYFSHKYLLEGNALVNAMLLAHNSLKEKNYEKEMNNRGGASGIGMALSENILTVASTGNCAAYLLRKGHFEQIVYPDTIKSVATDFFVDYFSTAPLSGFGLFDDLHLQIKELKVAPDDLIVTLTDGVYSRLVEEELKYILQKNNIGLKEKINELFNLGNTRGNLDNQSAIMLRF